MTNSQNSPSNQIQNGSNNENNQTSAAQASEIVTKNLSTNEVYNFKELQKTGYDVGFLANNRTLNENHVKCLKESIITMGQTTNPIVFTDGFRLDELGFDIKDQHGKAITDSAVLTKTLVPIDGAHRTKAALQIFENMKGKPEHELPQVTAIIVPAKDKDFVDSFLMEANVNSKTWDSEAYLRSLLSHTEFQDFDRTRMEFTRELMDAGLKSDNALRLATGDEGSIPTKTQLSRACVADGEKTRAKLGEKRNVLTIKTVLDDLYKHLGIDLLNNRSIVKQLVKIISNESYLANNIDDIKGWLDSITPDDTKEMAAFKNTKNGDSKDVKLHKKMEAMYTRCKGQTKTP